MLYHSWCLRTTVRKERKDKIENAYPNACQFIVERILEHTQPCAFKTRTLHDFSSRLFHCRDVDSYCLKCLTVDRCKTDPVHYLECTKEQLYDLIMGELETQVQFPYANFRHTVFVLSTRRRLCIHDVTHDVHTAMAKFLEMKTF